MEDPETLMSADLLQLIILPAGIIAVLWAIVLTVLVVLMFGLLWFAFPLAHRRS